MSKPLDFPIPYPSQLPNDDLVAARMLISAVTTAMEEGGGLASSEVQSLFNVLCAAEETLSVIQLFLDDCECPNLEGQYQAARRLWILQKGGSK